jgi:uncharacterized protein YbjT (DUF2867 family)
MEKLKLILTGATGMVGEGVLMTCLQDPQVEKVLSVSRKPSGIQHPKLEELIISDFMQLNAVEQQLTGYQACLFCLGISSIGISKPDYYQTTYTLTLHFGTLLSKLNPGMSFCYISGAGTDSSEKGRSSWARVKGKTENDLMKLPFKHAFGVRPAFIKPLPTQKNILSFYKYVAWMFPLGRKLYPAGFCRVEELAKAMLYVSKNGYSKNILEGGDIVKLGSL